MPGIDYRQLRQHVSMAKVLNLIRFEATWQRGPQLRGPCPIPGCCSSSHRAFSVHLARQFYRCFACGSHGNPLDLWAAVHGLPFHRAAVHLCRAVNIVPPALPTRCPSRRVPIRAPSRNR